MVAKYCFAINIESANNPRTICKNIAMIKNCTLWNTSRTRCIKCIQRIGINLQITNYCKLVLINIIFNSIFIYKNIVNAKLVSIFKIFFIC